MKNHLLINAFLICFQGIWGQETFIDIYKKASALTDSIYQARRDIELSMDLDSLTRIKMLGRVNDRFIRRSDAIFNGLVKTTFPDVNFTDANGKGYAVSDFKESLVINYNYLFCTPCINRIDATLARCNAKIIVLFTEQYRKDLSLLKSYNDRVVPGFINDETADFISLRQGDNCMYFIDKDRTIEFYDNRDSRSWIKFLEDHKK